MYSIYLSKEKFKNHMELLLIENADKAQSDKLDYVYIKDVNRCMYNKTNQKGKTHILYELFTMLHQWQNNDKS